jgi:hypothetical protein
MTHERSPKNQPLDTVLYEIDMLRHCAGMLPSKYNSRSSSEQAMKEYYVYIETFLLHLRNILAFLTNQSSEPADLRINQIGTWLDRAVAPREYSDLIAKSKDVNRRFGTDKSTCYDQISKFLQHCTTYRHERGRSWEIEKIFSDVNPILCDFEARFTRSTRATVQPESAPSSESNSTASFRVYNMIDDY